MNALPGRCGSLVLPALVAVLGACAEPAAQRSAPVESGATPILARVPAQVGADEAGIGQTVPNLSITTLAGATLSLDDLRRDRSALVLAIASAECPLAVEYGPRMAAIEQEFSGQAAFVHVNVVDGESLEAIESMVRESGLRGTYARDDAGDVRRALRPKTTTEVYVLDSARRIVYRGAIDDQYRLGGKASKVTQEYLKDALRAVTTGGKPRVTATSAPGCLVDMPRAAPTRSASASSISFYPRVADVLARNCIECHQPGGAGAFSLVSPASVDGRAAMIAAVVRDGLMPPNHGLSWTGPEPTVRDRTMTREDRELLLAWLESDRSTGSSPADGQPPIVSRRASGREAGREGTWAIGTPDFMLITPGPTLQPQDVPRTQRYFIPINLDQDAWVEAIECRSVMRDSVGAAQIWLVRPGEALPTMDQFPPSEELFATFSRSDRIVEYGNGAARHLPAHAVLVVDLVGRAMAQPEPSQLRIAMRFASAPPQREIRTRVVYPKRVRIEPGVAHASVQAQASLPENARLIALRPLMGPRVQAMRMWISSRGQSPRELIQLNRYDWRWLIRYPLREPFALNGTSRIEAEWTLNNSASNPVNPDPSLPVQRGIGDGREQLGVALEFEIDVATQP